MKTIISERYDFQKFILNELETNNGYLVRDAKKHYSQHLAMHTELLIKFLETTQEEQIAAFRKIHKEKADEILISTINAKIADRGLLHVLKYGIELGKGQEFCLMYKKLASLKNPKHLKQYEQNIFSVMEEVVISEKERIDLVVFLNGLAIMAFELKSNTSGQDIDDAVEQYRTQRDPKNRLFLFKSGTLVNFAMDLNEVRMTTRLEGEKTYFLPFNIGKGTGIDSGAGNPIVEGKYSVSYMWEDILKKDSLIDLIGNFIYVERAEKLDPHTGKRKIKETLIFPRFHQFDVVRKLLEDVRQNRTSCNYLIQHSAGSGKTKSIAWLAHRLISQYDTQDKIVYDTVLIVTDRIVVDRQLQEAVCRLDHKSGVIRVIDERCSSQDLRLALEKKTKIIGTTIQKFPYILDRVASLKDRTFAVIIDEAHSSTSGLSMAALTHTLNKDDKELKSTEDVITEQIKKSGKQPNMSVFAFTATPKATTLQLFGTPNEHGHRQAFHLYSMKQAIEEGFILDVLTNYTEYSTFYKLNKAIKEDPQLKTSDAKRQIARFVSLHETNIAQRVEIIIEHFRTSISHELDGKAKAMVITSSREEAVKYKQAFEKYVANHNYTDIKALVAFSGKVMIKEDGDAEYTEVGMNGFSEDKLPEKFDSDDYQILLVANKYQTGFDQPKLCAMYVLKKLQGVAAVQTLSRLNRICPPYNKKTFILDFKNTYEEIKNAFAPYYTATFLANSVNSSSIYELEAKVDGYDLIDNFDINRLADLFILRKLDSKQQADIQNAIQRVVKQFKKLEIKDQKEFRATVRGFIRCYEFMIQSTCLEDIDLHKKYKFLTVLLDQLNIGKTGTGVDLTGKLLATGFIQKKGKVVLTPKQISKAFIKLASAEGFIITEDKEEKLSEIIAELNRRLGKNFDSDVVVKSMLQVKDLLLKSPQLSTSAKNNTERDFEFAFFDQVDEALMSGWTQNKEFFSLLLNNEDIQKDVLGIFIPEVYRQLRDSTQNESTTFTK